MSPASAQHTSGGGLANANSIHCAIIPLLSSWIKDYVRMSRRSIIRYQCRNYYGTAVNDRLLVGRCRYVENRQPRNAGISSRGLVNSITRSTMHCQQHGGTSAIMALCHGYWLMSRCDCAYIIGTFVATLSTGCHCCGHNAWHVYAGHGRYAMERLNTSAVLKERYCCRLIRHYGRQYVAALRCIS